jgi:hypothetical protein
MRRPQFTLRALLILLLAVACFFGGIHFERERRRLEEEAARAAVPPPQKMVEQGQRQPPVLPGTYLVGARQTALPFFVAVMMPLSAAMVLPCGVAMSLAVISLSRSFSLGLPYSSSMTTALSWSSLMECQLPLATPLASTIVNSFVRTDSSTSCRLPITQGTTASNATTTTDARSQRFCDSRRANLLSKFMVST